VHKRFIYIKGPFNYVQGRHRADKKAERRNAINRTATNTAALTATITDHLTATIPRRLLARRS